MGTDMNGKRYRNQYESHTKIDPLTGKETRAYQYTGAYYRFAADKRQLRTARRWIACGAVLFWIGFLAGGFMNAPGSYSMWVLPFFLLSVFPGFYASLAAWRHYRLPAGMTVMQKEKSHDSTKNSAWGIVILSVLASAGSLVVLLTGTALGKEAEEMLFLGISLLRLIAGWGMLHGCKGLPLEEVVPPQAPKSPEG